MSSTLQQPFFVSVVLSSHKAKDKYRELDGHFFLQSRSQQDWELTTIQKIDNNNQALQQPLEDPTLCGIWDLAKSQYKNLF